jgi:hypothetical protein
MGFNALNEAIKKLECELLSLVEAGESFCNSSLLIPVI